MMIRFTKRAILTISLVFFCAQVVDFCQKWQKDRSTVVNRALFVGLKRSMMEMKRASCPCKTFPEIVSALVLCLFGIDRKKKKRIATDSFASTRQRVPTFITLTIHSFVCCMIRFIIFPLLVGVLYSFLYMLPKFHKHSCPFQ